MTSAVAPAAPTTGDPGELNSSIWAQGTYVSSYAHRSLRPVEVLLMLRYHEQFGGRVLELGCGAGRITGYLAELTDAAFGIDLAEPMIREARARFPRATFIEGDIRDLSQFETGSLDIVFAGCSIMDIFGDTERRRTLAEIRRVLRAGGLLIMSSHNRAHLPQMPTPTALMQGHPLRVARDAMRIPTRIMRHRRLSSLERSEPDYALVNNSAHDFALVHYFIGRDAQMRQFTEEQFDPVACLDLDGRPLESGETAPDSLELHYVAAKRDG